jgi:hypothetical protein
MMKSDSTITTADALYEALMEVETTGAFAAGGKLEGCPLPGLVVEGVGAIALPLQPDQAESLAKHSVQAPFGRGADTVVDTAVRLCRQIEPAKIQLGAAWNAYIQKRAAAYVDQLGVSNDNVEARLYKLVLYEEGGFFKSHKDTEKEPGMFGSLVVQLPAKHDAGTLAVRHRGEEKLFDFSNDSDSYFYAAAFYTDCKHELHPVKNGTRLCLLYNLVRVGGDGPLPSLAEHDALCDTLLQIAYQWENDENPPEKLCLALDHEYTSANLAFRNLKGADKARVDALLKSNGFELHLALVEKYMKGTPMYERNYRYKRYEYDSDNDGGYGQRGKHYEMEDCFESSTTVLEWVGVPDSDEDIVSMTTSTWKTRCSTVKNYLIPMPIRMKKILRITWAIIVQHWNTGIVVPCWSSGHTRRTRLYFIPHMRQSARGLMAVDTLRIQLLTSLTIDGEMMN